MLQLSEHGLAFKFDTMERISVRAPANVKIAGEHSVVYGGLSLSAAITLYATADATETSGAMLEIALEDLGISASFGRDELMALYGKYRGRDSSSTEGLRKYIEGSSEIKSEMLPYATIAARFLGQYGVDVINKKITISSQVPAQRGYASSAVRSAAFAMSVLKSCGVRLDDATAVDVIRDGERIAHRMEGAGCIDVGTAYYGGFATLTASDGIRKEDLPCQIRLVVFDTGPKPPTAQMLMKVKALYDSDTKGTAAVFREIDGCVSMCINAIRSGDNAELGRQMSRNHELLRRLGVSSAMLDKAVSVALSAGAYGAKLCGGGGGGIGVALVSDDQAAGRVISAMLAEGFEAQRVEVAMDGARLQR